MCLNPRTIYVKVPDLARRLSDVDGHRSLLKYRKDKIAPDAYVRSYRPAKASELYCDILPGPRTIIVPCGRCVECLRVRQNDVAARCAEEAKYRKSMHFLTLTYDPKKLPISHFERRYDSDTGEYVGRNKFEVKYADSVEIDKGDVVSDVVRCVDLRSKFNSMKGSPSPKYLSFVSDSLDDDGKIREDVYTPSLCRRDVRLWLKAARVAFEREKGESLPEFTYVCTGEYGPKTCRPHYHLLFFGLEDKHVRYLAWRWYKHHHYGTYKLKTVQQKNADGTPGFELCSKYVGKYICKGEFESSACLNKHCERPRLMLSKNLGLSFLTPALVEYFRADDIFGKVDLMSLKFGDGEVINRTDAEFLREQVLQRQHYTWSNGQKSNLPKSFQRKIWYFKEKYHENLPFVYRPTSLRRALSVVSPPDSTELYIQSLLTDYPGIQAGLFGSLVRSYISGQEIVSSVNEGFKREYLSRFYGHSIH